METAESLDTFRSFVMLAASIVTLIAAVLTFLTWRLKEAPTEEARKGVYRSAIGWVETGLWAVSPLTLMLPNGASWALCVWIPAYALTVYQFLSNKDSNRLRAEIFKLIFGAQAIVLMVVMAIAQSYLSLFERLLSALEGK